MFYRSSCFGRSSGLNMIWAYIYIYIYIYICEQACQGPPVCLSRLSVQAIPYVYMYVPRFISKRGGPYLFALSCWLPGRMRVSPFPRLCSGTARKHAATYRIKTKPKLENACFSTDVFIEPRAFTSCSRLCIGKTARQHA